MLIITYSETTQTDIRSRLGQAEYSYYFIYAKYKPILEKLGTVVAVQDPSTEVDKVYEEQPPGTCVFLSFTPPHRTAQNLRCPTVCVFAWEFSSMPTQDWEGHPELDWAGALNNIGHALGISKYSVDVAAQVVAAHVSLAAVPAPVNAPQGWQREHKVTAQTLRLDAVLYDSHELVEAADGGHSTASAQRSVPMWDDEPLAMAFVQSDARASKALHGFYALEEWGVWSRTRSPEIMLPVQIAGPAIIELELVGHGANVDRELQLEIGGVEHSLILSEQSRHYSLEVTLATSAAVLRFVDLELTSAAGRDNRTLGIGLKSLSVRRPTHYRPSLLSRLRKHMTRLFGTAKSEADGAQGELLSLDGIVYSSVLNPEDGRKNWEDMVSAFCLAFADVEDATLLLKMSNANASTFLGPLKLLFSTLPAFKCRVVAIHGYLSDEALQSLANSTHFVVNSSLCEGQCLPLMEYMAQGVPAIAPDHTAMADYINTDNAFVVASSLQPAYWPFDPFRSLQTQRYRLNWGSLRDAFVSSYAVVTAQPAQYEKMRTASIAAVERVAGQDTVSSALDTFLHAVLNVRE